MGANKPNMEFFDFAPAPAGFKWVRDKENGEWKLIQTDDGMSRGDPWLRVSSEEFKAWSGLKRILCEEDIKSSDGKK
jgi:hypothetical protein